MVNVGGHWEMVEFVESKKNVLEPRKFFKKPTVETGNCMAKVLHGTEGRPEPGAKEIPASPMYFEPKGPKKTEDLALKRQSSKGILDQAGANKP